MTCSNGSFGQEPDSAYKHGCKQSFLQHCSVDKLVPCSASMPHIVYDFIIAELYGNNRNLIVHTMDIQQQHVMHGIPAQPTTTPIISSTFMLQTATQFKSNPMTDNEPVTCQPARRRTED